MHQCYVNAPVATIAPRQVLDVATTCCAECFDRQFCCSCLPVALTLWLNCSCSSPLRSSSCSVLLRKATWSTASLTKKANTCTESNVLLLLYPIFSHDSVFCGMTCGLRVGDTLAFQDMTAGCIQVAQHWSHIAVTKIPRHSVWHICMSAQHWGGVVHGPGQLQEEECRWRADPQLGLGVPPLGSP